MNGYLPEETKRINQSLAEIALRIQPVIAETKRNIAKAFERLGSNIDMYALAEGMRRFESGLPDQLKLLAQHGWFISWWETPLAWIYPLASLFREGKFDEGNSRLCAHFAKCLPGIELHFEQNVPERFKILRKAFKAHRDGDYELCIPVFLAQADGIGNEAIGASIYSRQPKSVQKITEYIDAVAKQQMDRVMLELVLLPTPLNVSKNDPLLLQEALNRHEVLHGVSTTYASLLNSFKAISWLQYVAHFQEAQEIAAECRKSANDP